MAIQMCVMTNSEAPADLGRRATEDCAQQLANVKLVSHDVVEAHAWMQEKRGVHLHCGIAR